MSFFFVLLSAPGSICNDKGGGFSDLRSMFRQVYFTLSKIHEIFDISTVSEAPKQILISSPHSKDKLFFVSLERFQEEVNKALPDVKLYIKVTDWERFVKTNQITKPSSFHQPKGSSSSSSQPINRSAFSRWKESQSCKG